MMGERRRRDARHRKETKREQALEREWGENSERQNGVPCLS